METQIGTPLYMAPEIVKGEKYSSNSDLYSLGCIYYEMLTGSMLNKKAKTFSVLYAFACDPTPVALPDYLSPWSKVVLKGLLQKDPDKRFSREHFSNIIKLNKKVIKDLHFIEHLNMEEKKSIPIIPKKQYVMDTLILIKQYLLNDGYLLMKKHYLKLLIYFFTLWIFLVTPQMIPDDINQPFQYFQKTNTNNQPPPPISNDFIIYPIITNDNYQVESNNYPQNSYLPDTSQLPKDQNQPNSTAIIIYTEAKLRIKKLFLYIINQFSKFLNKIYSLVN